MLISVLPIFKSTTIKIIGSVLQINLNKHLNWEETERCIYISKFFFLISFNFSRQRNYVS